MVSKGAENDYTSPLRRICNDIGAPPIDFHFEEIIGLLSEILTARHCYPTIRGGRHDQIRDQIYQEAQRAGFNPKKEMPALIPGSQSRPADIFVEGLIDGRRTAFDVSVRTPSSTELPILPPLPSTIGKRRRYGNTPTTVLPPAFTSSRSLLRLSVDGTQQPSNC